MGPQSGPGSEGSEGGGIALSGDEYEVSVTGLAFYVIWHEKHYDDQPPLSGGTIKIRKAIPS